MGWGGQLGLGAVVLLDLLDTEKLHCSCNSPCSPDKEQGQLLPRANPPGIIATLNSLRKTTGGWSRGTGPGYTNTDSKEGTKAYTGS